MAVIRTGSWLWMLALGMMAARGLRTMGAVTDPVADAETQYQATLAALKNPPLSGVLITEVEPDSPAATAGLRGGDIIIEYYSAKITSLEVLRQQVADAMARHIENSGAMLSGSDRVVLRARRGAGGREMVVVQLPREPLGVRAVDVQAGVAGPRNDPASARGTIVLDWRQVMAAAGEDDSGTAALKTFMHIDVAAEGNSKIALAGTQWKEEWLGWQTMEMHSDGDETVSGKVDVNRIEVESTAVQDHSSFSFHLQLGDYKTSSAFVMDEASAEFTGGDGLMVKYSAKRVGGVFRVDTAGESRQAEYKEYATPLNAIVQPALPFVAGALPHEKGAVLGLCLMPVRDFIPRPGYALETRGREAIPLAAAKQPAGDAIVPPSTAAAVESAWRVDLQFCGVTVESYWFSDQRRLLCIESIGVQSLISRSVPSVKIAETPMEIRPASRPATRSAAR